MQIFTRPRLLISIVFEYKEKCRSENSSFEISYHINPDGDCIGSAYGLALILRSFGAKCAVTGRDEVPAQFGFLTGGFVNDEVNEPVLIGVDCQDRSRIGKDRSGTMFGFWIDHHGSEEEQAEYEYVVPDASSCCELVLLAAEKMGAVITPQTADLLFMGLVTDTDCFRTIMNCCKIRCAISAKDFAIIIRRKNAGGQALYAIALGKFFQRNKNRERQVEMYRLFCNSS